MEAGLQLAKAERGVVDGPGKAALEGVKEALNEETDSPAPETD